MHCAYRPVPIPYRYRDELGTPVQIDDHRKGGVVRPSRNYATKRKTPAGRPNTKRGCVCHFIVKRLIAEPSVALIIYNQDKHVDKKGLPCHGPLDKKAAGTRAMFAPYISDELRLQIMSLLYVGVPVETIMQRHSQMVQKQGGPCSRDDLLTHRYVRRLERKIRRSAYELDPDDDVSIGLWIESHRDLIFFFENFSDSDPFVLGIQTEWQLQQMIHFGNRSILASDSRFGTYKLKYPIYSLLVFDSNKNAIPVAWVITPNFASAWTDAVKSLPVASSEVSTAIESYHQQLKLRLLNENDSNVYQRADWLVDKLGTKVHSYYWLDEYSEKDNFARYWRDEWRCGFTSWRQAIQIPDSDVAIDGTCAKVVNQKDRNKVHVVSNPGSNFATCDCHWSRMGNLCEHVIKSTKVYRDRGLAASSTSLIQFNRMLTSIFYCPPHDSVIRDHAIALAVSVQTQLKTLIDLESGSALPDIKVLREKQVAKDMIDSVTEKPKNADKDIISSCLSVSNNIKEDLKNESIALETLNDREDVVMQSTGTLDDLQPTEGELVTTVSMISDHTENEAGTLFYRNNGLANDNRCEAEHSSDPMIVDTIKNIAGGCGSSENPLIIHDENANISFDDIDGAKGCQAGYVADGCCNNSVTIETATVDSICGVRTLAGEPVSWEVVARVCNEQLMDDNATKENVSVDVSEQIDGLADKAREESSKSAQLSLDIGPNPNANCVSSLIDVESVIEVQVANSCSPCGKDGAKLATNASPVGNGASNSMEESGNDLMVT
ncbi:hypothetical protein BHM03_00049409 [Ensete ventricosum]|nr:hypothetical protein BHM03_00049409 [Ensete ventricosum]